MAQTGPSLNVVRDYVADYSTAAYKRPTPWKKPPNRSI
jgi:hypothetical protein